MHGGKLFLRGDCRNLKFPPQVTADIASFEDLQGIMDDLKEYCSDFHYDLKPFSPLLYSCHPEQQESV